MMSPESWQKIKRIFDEAVELPAAGRAAYLDAACVDASVRLEVERMLAADEDDALEESAFSLLPHDEGVRVELERVGRYRVLREVGRGGMGAVYEAVRDDGEFEQTVAVKVIKTGLDTQAIVGRFRRERQILAQLEHTNIARLLDGGVTEAGLPFYVMEFVEGVPIDEYCRANDLDVEGRLELFRQVCAAVSYAHARLIVHRDLKPSNILVTKEGQAKLLDFGIAKVLSRDAGGPAPETATQLGLMTPDYASPEQFRGEAVTTATDIYSLGVVLYQLLTNALPYDLAGLRLDRMLDVICNTEPPRPSRAAVASDDSAGVETRPVSTPEANEKGARRASGRPRTSARDRRLEGDLDNIVLKALRKEPAQRYATVEQFSEDIRRHLAGLPVSARPATFGYRAGKFVKRNPLAVGLSFVAALTLAGGVAATGWQAVRAERARRVAERRFAQSRALANSLVFKYHDAIAALPNSSPVRELLLKDASAYLDELAADAGGDAALTREVAQAYLKLGDIQGRPHSASTGNTAAAIESYGKAVALLETAARDPRPAESRQARRDLISAYKRINTALARAKERGAERQTYFDKRIAIVEGLLAEEPGDASLLIELTDARTGIGNALLRSDFERGFGYYEENVLPLLSEVLRAAPEQAETERLVRKIYADLGWHAAEHARYLLELGEGPGAAVPYFERAFEYFRRMAEIYERQYARAPEDLANRRGRVVGIVNVGISLRDLGRVEEALAMISEGRRLHSELASFDPHNLQAVFDLGNSYAETAVCHLLRKDYARAFADFEEALAYMDRVIAADPKHHEAITYKVDLLAQLGDAYAEAGKLGAAVEHYERAKEYGRRALTEEPSDRVQLGRLFLSEGRTLAHFAALETDRQKAAVLWRRAQDELRRAAEIVSSSGAPNAPKQMRLIERHLLACERALGES